MTKHESRHLPTEQQAVWDNINQRISEKGTELIKLNFYRYKAYYTLTKRPLVEADGQLARHPSLSDAALATNYQRAKDQSMKLDASFKEDVNHLRALNDACLKADEPYSAMIVDKARRYTQELRSYNAHHAPSLAQIEAAYEKIHLTSPKPEQPEPTSGL